MKIYKKIGKRCINLFPGIDIRLKQAEMKINPEVYIGKTILTSVFFSIISFALLFSINVILKLPEKFLPFILLIPLALSLIVFFYNSLYPNLVVSKRINNIEKNLLFSLRFLLVEIRSGIPLYNAFLSLSKGNYGAISKEFKEITKKISVGIPETKALEEVMLRNPSINFRRVLWQIVNAIESGSDIGNTLEELVKEFSTEQRTAIRMYGGQLNTFALVYMIFAIIVPSIGICFLVILSFFMGIPINSGILFLILILISVFQFMFLGIVKSKRPKVE